MDDRSMLTRIEELSMNALPALQTQIFAGWLLRFSNGYTKRANSINPIYPSSGHLESKIRQCEQIFRKRNLRVVYKMTANVYPADLDNILEKNGYRLDGLTSVQVLPLLEVEIPSVKNVQADHKINDKWFSSFCFLNTISENDQPTLKRILSNIIPETVFMLVTDGRNETVACGLGVLEDEYIGLFDIVTNEKFRNKGYGKQLILNLLHWGKNHGAKHAYLQVVLDNKPALNLYSKLGFKEKFQYWYRIKE